MNESFPFPLVCLSVSIHNLSVFLPSVSVLQVNFPDVEKVEWLNKVKHQRVPLFRHDFIVQLSIFPQAQQTHAVQQPSCSVD